MRLGPTDAYPLLVVDDDPLVRTRLEIVLGLANFDVRTASNGREALEALRREPVPMVLTDWRMPDLEGPALCKAIRAEHFDEPIYLVLFTMQDTDRDIAEGLAAGADDFLSKRSSDAHLVGRLRIGRRVATLERDVRLSRAENRRLATIEAHTGAFNRRYLMSALPRELERARRYGRSLSVIACDIDGFRKLSERHGEDVADDVLQGVAAALASGLRANVDWVARVEGDEFLIVLPETSAAQARGIAEKLRIRIAATPMATAAGVLKVTMSLGSTGVDDAEASISTGASDLILLARHYLSRARLEGGDRVLCPAMDLPE